MKQKVNKEVMRQNNILLIFEAIYRHREITRAQLAAETDMSAMAVGRIADFLLEQNLITEEFSGGLGDIGRPAKRLRVNPTLRCAGVSLDPNGAFIGTIDPYGRLLHFRRHPFEPEAMEPAEALRHLGGLIRGFLDEYHAEDPPSVGLVIPGLIDNAGRQVCFSSQLKWKDIPAPDILESCPGVPKIILDNDIKARAQAENRFGSAKGYPSAVLLNIGSGVGAGVIIDGEIYRGRRNLAGEIGHTALGINNRMCACGRGGCLEATISQPAVLQEARMVDPLIDIPGLEAAYRKEAQWARTLLHMTAGHILMAINLLANAYAPDVVVLCGSLMDQCGVLREIVMRSHKEQEIKMFHNPFALEFSAFGPDGNIIGAAVAAMNHNIRQSIACSRFSSD